MTTLNELKKLVMHCILCNKTSEDSSDLSTWDFGVDIDDIEYDMNKHGISHIHGLCETCKKELEREDTV